MAVEIVCGNCGQPFGVEAEWAGMAVQCPACEVAVQVPDEVAPESGRSAGTTSAPGISIDTGGKPKDRPEDVTIEIQPDQRRTNSKRAGNNVSEASPQYRTKSRSDKSASDAGRRSAEDLESRRRWKAPPESGTSEPVQKRLGKRRADKKTTDNASSRSSSRQKGAASAESDASVTGNDLKTPSPGIKRSPPKPAAPTSTDPGTQSLAGNSPKKTDSPAARKREDVPDGSPSSPSQDPTENRTAAAHPSGIRETDFQETSEPDDRPAINEVESTSEPDRTVPAKSAPDFVLRPFPPQFPPKMDQALGLGSAVEIHVRSGIKEIEYQGEKVLVRDDDSVRNLYQIVGFIISLIILVGVLAWVTFR